MRLRSLPTLWIAAAWGLAYALLAPLPLLWVNLRVADLEEAWFQQALPMASRITQAYLSPGLSGFDAAHASRPVLRAHLQAHPLNHALVDLQRGEVWMRDGATGAFRITRAPSTDLYRDWARRAEASGSWPWLPPFRDPANRTASFAVVPPQTSGFPYTVIKRWEPGSPAVDRFLAEISEGWMPVRMGLTPHDSWEEELRSRRARWRPRPLPPLRAAHPLQVLHPEDGYPVRLARPMKWGYSEGWTPLVMMPDASYRAFRATARTFAALAWSLYGALGLLLASAFRLYLVRQRRQRLEAERLAALAHSLKTPLTMLRLDCDSLRNAGLPELRREALLLRIGDGVDALRQLIEDGLEAFRKPGRANHARIDPAFFRAIEEDFRPAFEEEGRNLALLLEAPPFQADAQALRTALCTLLENALVHGQGTVLLRTVRARRRTRLQVVDQGPGIPQAVLHLLEGPGAPPAPAGQASPRAGQGMGLFLLRSMATRSGWKLRFRRDATGFTAELETA